MLSRRRRRLNAGTTTTNVIFLLLSLLLLQVLLISPVTVGCFAFTNNRHQNHYYNKGRIRTRLYSTDNNADANEMITPFSPESSSINNVLSLLESNTNDDNHNNNNNNSNNPIYFPPESTAETIIQTDETTYNNTPTSITNSNNKEEKIQQQLKQGTTFEDACYFAIETQRPLYLLQDINNLPDTIILKKRQQLTIRGTGLSSLSLLKSSQQRQQPTSLSSSSSSSTNRIRIKGSIYNLFLLNNHSTLILQDVELVHGKDEDEEKGNTNQSNTDCRKVGAAIQLRYKASTQIDNCAIKSYEGFCVWGVQKTKMTLNHCELEAPLRSALVCFGQTQLTSTDCTIKNSGVHGVCARGECTIQLINTSIIQSAVRGLYAYANAAVTLQKCTISQTIRSDMAAIEVCSSSSASAGTATAKTTTKGIQQNTKTSSLFMNQCTVVDNAGVGVRIRGNVRHNLNENENLHLNEYENDENSNTTTTNNLILRNGGGKEIDFRLSSVEEGIITEDTTKNNDNTHNQQHQMRRDDSGSSFRKGDWWCPNCIHPKRVIHVSKDSCPFCQVEKNHKYILSTQEVIELNRGVVSIPIGSSSILSTTTKSSNIFASTPSPTSTTVNNKEGAASPQDIVTMSPTWWFDGGDYDIGYLPYDVKSSQQLEDAYQTMMQHEIMNVDFDSNSKLKMTPGATIMTLTPTTSTTINTNPEPNRTVILSSGKYTVDLQKMEQTNTESHFLRLVQRREK